MSKVTNHQPLYHGEFTFEADTGSASVAAIRVICVGGVYLERHDICGRVDGDEALGDSFVILLVSDWKGPVSQDVRREGEARPHTGVKLYAQRGRQQIAGPPARGLTQ